MDWTRLNKENKVKKSVTNYVFLFFWFSWFVDEIMGKTPTFKLLFWMIVFFIGFVGFLFLLFLFYFYDLLIDWKYKRNWEWNETENMDE